MWDKIELRSFGDWLLLTGLCGLVTTTMVIVLEWLT